MTRNFDPYWTLSIISQQLTWNQRRLDSATTPEERARYLKYRAEFLAARAKHARQANRSRLKEKNKDTK